ncbi:MAG: phospholipase D-like domain-containing protein [Candidatus Bathyarchaeota archaeon]|nr:phospholipase D-like domain-containing protein [Candidatus Bathyarchaeota archaeon]
MVSKLFLSWVIIGLLIGVTIGYAVSIPKTSELESRVTSSEQENDLLQTQVEQLTKDLLEVITLRQSNQALEAQIQSIQTQMSQKIAQLNDLTNQLNTAVGEKTSLQIQLAQIQNSDPYPKINSLESQVKSLNQQIAEKNILISDLQSQLISMKANSLELIEVSFSPIHDTDGLIQSWIERANSTIDVAIYSFTRNSLADALISAKNRGVNVRVITEQDTISDSGSEYYRLKSAGLSIIADSSGGLMHDKFFVIDGKIVGTGSYNWTSDAEDHNAENLLVIKSSSLASTYLNEFEYWWGRYS